MERKVRGRNAAVNYLNQTTNAVAKNLLKRMVCCCNKTGVPTFTDDGNRRIRRILNDRSILYAFSQTTTQKRTGW